ncbi:acetyl-CoA carboxyl transferase [Rhodococcus sp. BP-149]|uniref:carboxyl transferase domain-containing protein n=1 Tax=unclassified Rhodococcus (in: high G+C Gram-positive bacteria) TaxID=192944 RepID=UPI001C9AB28A|nr:MULTISPECIES: carboxyl transferase domain-containing protein [unclassified Rhodococcus (in: high G+C Gram-positive bacteria)]MBY6679023.1 acetyl-CoA carboxyl transferase [Rhodococcus sp. BP-332]MBY6685449.1 acetyl-CoA carboxyl transferase [Rhodococcus sp. BP-288]MBY6694986.1 acetyl-CoA carboxyl transferase [Rhodococcus sp. BP-188]MBY6696849.1 acetyl-CoA carboxyl transferase [Rhodococcus sp. BP-285]MBY6703505.1 acetyl-CoA carboxyl transferase [Rhodococcus sp. BP-283]
MAGVGALALLDIVVDAGSFESWDSTPHDHPVDEAYTAELAAAREKTGLDESVITGVATISGRRVAILLCEFRFLGGSIGVAAGERLTTAVRRATAERLPLLALPTSGGTRMQEGTVAFLQMVKITAAVTAHKAAHLPYIVYLRHPTTGGVFASWGSLGHVTIAEPGALVGFLGPRVYEALYDTPFPTGVQTSENLQAHGLVDAVKRPDQLGEVVDRALRIMTLPAGTRPRPAPAPEWSIDDVPAWDSIVASRRADRPGVRELLYNAASDVLPLNGTGQGETDPGLILALVRFGDMPCVLLGQDRRGQTPLTPLGPAALREARRGMRLAAELRLPLVTVIDTAGAALSKEAEEGGLGAEIARSIADMVDLDTPTISVLLGQGTGGGALALVPADRVLAAQHAWLSPLPPEGASAIVHRDTAHAPDMAVRQGVRSLDLRGAGIVDLIVPEYPDAADEVQPFCDRVGSVLHRELADLLAEDPDMRRIAREKRFDRIGSAMTAV